VDDGEESGMKDAEVDLLAEAPPPPRSDVLASPPVIHSSPATIAHAAPTPKGTMSVLVPALAMGPRTTIQ
jgi:hypothetical protein